ncbi:hypothetical protein XENOCAPTIV_027970 [Xenoophorus captivus]|uniref:Uncharacterized protein n=1 Tax=Xenoophorus captivus TaxID=1517983 RepID=A0ABV0Q6I3_9TELE
MFWFLFPYRSVPHCLCSFGNLIVNLFQLTKMFLVTALHAMLICVYKSPSLSSLSPSSTSRFSFPSDLLPWFIGPLSSLPQYLDSLVFCSHHWFVLLVPCPMLLLFSCLRLPTCLCSML